MFYIKYIASESIDFSFNIKKLIVTVFFFFGDFYYLKKKTF